ncbi:MAG: outer membrane lipoprotein carrier protein LolA [Deltaproteobacteria bacterium]|nr:outer membrane lipoprotein carrier protein LolA [Deltaproteobacteria bacterium]
MRFVCGLMGILFTALLAVVAFAADEDEALLRKVVAAVEGPFQAGTGKAAAISDFQVDFSQESEILSLGQKQTASGRAVFKFLCAGESSLVSPLFRWEYREPHQQQIVADGKSIWFHIPENQQAILSDARKSLAGDENANPLAFLTNIDDLGRFFDIGWAAPRRDEGGNYLLRLLPRGQSPLLQSLVLGVSRKAVEAKGKKVSFPLHSILLTNVNGDKSLLILSNPRLNKGIANEDFRFAPPEGTDVLTPEQFRKAFQ